jgi:predicted ATP-binding protein involved in virulence
MRIDNLYLKNYRCFAELSLDLHHQLTVLVAPNGVGKTSILNAIKVALWPYVAGFDLGSITNDITGIHVDDVRREKIRQFEMEPILNTEIKATGKILVSKILNRQRGKEQRWEVYRFRESVKNGTRTKEAKPDETENIKSWARALQSRVFSSTQKEPDSLPLLGYYGTGRLWNMKHLTDLHKITDKDSASRTYAYRDCLDASSTFKHFAAWFSRIYLSYLQIKLSNFQKKLPIAGLAQYAPVKAIQTAINAILKHQTGWHTLSFSVEHQELVLSHDQHGELKVSQLSDGIRNMLALAGDIAYRCYKLNAHMGEHAVRKTHGIVLIDEVDMHLHPSWQQTVLTDLTAAFPQLQFIVTTHSPQVLSTVHRDNIRLISQDIKGNLIAHKPLSPSYGVPSGDVLHGVMSVDPQPPIPEKVDLLRLTDLIDQGRFNAAEAKGLLKTLSERLGLEHQQLQRLQRSILRQKALA